MLGAPPPSLLMEEMINYIWRWEEILVVENTPSLLAGLHEFQDTSCQRKCHFRIFRIRLDLKRLRHVFSAVYSFTPPRRRHFGVAVAIAAETPWERRD